MNRLTKPRFLLAYMLVVWLFLVARTTERQLHIGILLALLGESVRVWANGYVGHVKVNWTNTWRGDAKIGRLITAGPYAFVRHPLYLGSFLIGAGFCVVVGNFWFSLAALGFFLIVYGMKMTSEEQLLRKECGMEYLLYHAAVPRWFPTGSRYPKRQGRWTWEGVRASKELKTVVWVIVCLLALYFREEFWQEHERFDGKEWLKHTLLALFGLLLMASDGIFELVRRTRRRRALQSSN